MNNQDKMREAFDKTWEKFGFSDTAIADKSAVRELCRQFQDVIMQKDAAHKEEAVNSAQWKLLAEVNAELAKLMNDQLSAAQNCIEQMRETLRYVKSDLFYQIESKHGAKAASKYPSIVKAEETLALQPSLSALYERDAKVLEEAADELQAMNSTPYAAGKLLRDKAIELRNGKKGG